jgi:hypothetical protein
LDRFPGLPHLILYGRRERDILQAAGGCIAVVKRPIEKLDYRRRFRRIRGV